LNQRITSSATSSKLKTAACWPSPGPAHRFWDPYPFS
jgi:hypothetical protein